MSLSRIFPPGYVFLAANGQGPNDSGYVYFRKNNSADLTTVYTDAEGTTASGNPLTLGSDGRLPNDVFTDQTLRITVEDANNAQIYQKDDVSLTSSSSVVATMADLKAIDVSNPPDTVYLKGYTADADGGEGRFYYDSGSSETADDGLIIAPDSGSGRWIRMNVQGEYSVNWFGGKGDNSTDSTTAISNAFAKAIADGGTVLFPDRGRYRTTEKVTISEDRSITVKGASVISNASDDATELSLVSGSDTALLDLQTAISCQFEGMRFSVDTNVATSAVTIVKVAAAGSTPVLSSINVQFKGCHFVPRGSGTLAGTNVWVYDAVNLKFEDCWFTGADSVALLGEDSGVNPATFGNGNLAGTIFNNCLFSGDVKHRRGWAFTYIGCSFQERSDGTPSTVVASNTDQQDRQTTFLGCAFFGGDNTRTLITQGTGGENLVVIGCRFTGSSKGIVINGEGNCLIAGNHFEGSNMLSAIEINDPARNVRHFGNSWEDLIAAGNSPIDDNTTTGSAHDDHRFWAVNNTVSADATLSGAGFTGNDFCSSNKSFDGGYYNVQFQVEVVSAETTVYEARFVVDGTTYGEPIKMTIPSGETATLSFSQALKIPVRNDVEVKLQVKQTSNSTPSTVKADATFLQCWSIGGEG